MDKSHGEMMREEAFRSSLAQTVSLGKAGLVSVCFFPPLLQKVFLGYSPFRIEDRGGAKVLPHFPTSLT